MSHPPLVWCCSLLLLFGWCCFRPLSLCVVLLVSSSSGWCSCPSLVVCGVVCGVWYVVGVWWCVWVDGGGGSEGRGKEGRGEGGGDAEGVRERGRGWRWRFGEEERGCRLLRFFFFSNINMIIFLILFIIIDHNNSKKQSSA